MKIIIIFSVSLNFIKKNKNENEEYLKDSDFHLQNINKSFPQDNTTLVSALSLFFQEIINKYI